ncbi:MAG: hypothetical protein N2C14_18075 [Planctomycetales bacterium]
MNLAFEKLHYFFGPLGLASIAAWAFAAVLIVAYALFLRNSRVCWTALVAAILGFVLAGMNSQNVSAIKIDFSQQLDDAKTRADKEYADSAPVVKSDVSADGEQAKRAESKDGKPGDGDSKDEKSKGGDDSTSNDADVKDEQANGKKQPKDGEKKESGYSYRQAGKVTRDEGKEVEDAEEKIDIEDAAPEEVVTEEIRTMKMEEVLHANRLDRLNLLFARGTLLAAVLFMFIDYFRRFNSTYDCYLPLPLGGKWVDSLFAKTHTVCDSEFERDWKKFLEVAVRKGETFIFLTEQDPWSQRFLPRLPGGWRLPWRLEIVRRDDSGIDDESLLESAWHGRYCFVANGDADRGVGLLETMADFLALRRETRATAGRTVNIVWNHPEDVPAELLDRLLPLCRDANFKLIVAFPSPPKADLAERFEQAIA